MELLIFYVGMLIRYLPSDLMKVARQLQRQILSAGLQGERTPLQNWRSLPPDIAKAAPLWLKELLSHYNLGFILFERTHETEEWGRFFSFLLPRDFTNNLEIWVKDFIKDGFFPISLDGDDDLWLVNIADGPLSQIYLFDNTSRRRIVAGENLWTFLMSCKISARQG